MERKPNFAYFYSMKKKLYIETSVWNQLEHTDRPEWKNTAKRFFESLLHGYYEPCVSDIVLDELLKTTNPKRRDDLMGQVRIIQPTLLPFDDEAQELTEKYMQAGFIKSTKRKIYNDSAHVAIATVNGIHHIISYNFEHLVNDIRIDSFNAVNFQNGYDVVVDITTPEKYIITGKEGL